MEISQNYANVQTAAVSKLNNRPPMPQGEPPALPESDALSGFLNNAKDDEEVKEFMRSVMDMEMSGNFDAATLAANAPDSLKEYAAQEGIDLEAYLNEKHENFSEMSNKMGGPAGSPPAKPEEAEESQLYKQVSQLSEEQQDLLSSLLSSLTVDTNA